MKIGEYLEKNKSVKKPIDIVSLWNTSKNQPRDNKGRYIHVGAEPPHIDDYDKRHHVAIAEQMEVSLRDTPKTVVVPWHYNAYCTGIGTPVFNIEIEKHVGSISLKGTPYPTQILVGSPDPSQSW